MRAVGELSAAIHEASSVPQVAQACGHVAASLGFNYFQYLFRIPLSLEPAQIVVSGYPREWVRRYDACSYLAVDPVVRRGLQAVLPFGWDEVAIATPQERAVFDDATRYGLAHGISAPIHGAHGEDGLLSLAREQPLPPTGDRLELIGRLAIFSGQLFERLCMIASRGLVQPGAAAALALTPREREVLQLAAEGRSAAEIARQIGISEHTVNFHVANAEAKLGARSRRHAVVRAVALGLVDPGCYPAELSGSRELVQVQVI